MRWACRNTRPSQRREATRWLMNGRLLHHRRIFTMQIITKLAHIQLALPGSCRCRTPSMVKLSIRRRLHPVPTPTVSTGCYWCLRQARSPTGFFKNVSYAAASSHGRWQGPGNTASAGDRDHWCALHCSVQVHQTESVTGRKFYWIQ